ncbi:HD-GYP domain-containing protein [Alteromonadaceae bacterium M269]|nr:HD-GYP domain-containing protein [Alteromonadaceae bacterium M269]
MLRTIKSSKLEIGMYVTRFVKQTGNMNLTMAGWIKTEAAMKGLIAKGILEVEIDTSKTLVAKTESENKEKSEKQKPISFDNELSRATGLYQQAKSFQKKLLNAVDREIAIDVKQVEAMSNKLVDSLERNSNALLCLTSIREKDSYLLEHSINVGIMLATFATYLGFDKAKIQKLAFAGVIHDIGKIKVPDEILHKPGKLTDDEFVIMRNHVNYGGDYLSQFDDLEPSILETVMQHHEKIDGTGYPNKLRDDEIGMYGRMISIVDCYDAMTAERVYKKGMPSMKAMKILMRESGVHFDGDLVRKFIQCIGLYPAGTLVKMKSQKVGLVTKVNQAKPLEPEVKIFYCAKNRHYLASRDINLAASHCKEEIEEVIKAEDYKIDFQKFFTQAVA